MKRLAVVTIAVLALTSRSYADPLKVYILAGQSNMEGQAPISTLPCMIDDPEGKALHDKMVDADGKPRVFDEIRMAAFSQHKKEDTERIGPLTAGYGKHLVDDEIIGVELAFGITMHEHLQKPFLIIKTSWGGKSLCRDFRPPSAGATEEFKESPGAYYKLMMQHVKGVLANPGKVCPSYNADDGYDLAGFVWFQGFNDKINTRLYNGEGDEKYALYSELLAHFIRDVRKELEAPKMPFVIGVMGMGGVENTDHVPFRKAMAAPAEMDEFKDTVIAVHTTKCWDSHLGELFARNRLTNVKQAKKTTKKNPEYKPLLAKLAPFLEQQSKVPKGKAGKEKISEIAAKMQEMIFTPEELRLLRTGITNSPVHYLGSAKIYSKIGKAFAEALIGRDN